MQNVGAAVGG